MRAQTTRLLLVTGALLIAVLLFLAPKKATSGEGPHVNASPSMASTADLSVFVNMATKNLETAEQAITQRLAAEKKFDSLIEYWGNKKRPDLSAYYSEQKALRSNTSEAWFQAGNRYYYSVQFIQDKSEIPVLYTSARRSFEKGLAIDSNNVDAKIMLASCYVEGSDQPMEGIRRLREIERIDSSNVKLQLAFAFFSVKSGQHKKAIERFEKVLKADSSYIEAYLHLADAYEQMNDTKKTVLMLRNYASKTSDPTAKVEIEKYIEQLKNNTNL